MPERLEKLKHTVRELEAELESVGSLDEESRQLLQEALAEIQTALQRKDAADMQPHTMAERLREAAEQFETSHPTLFGVLQRTIDALGQMGI